MFGSELVWNYRNYWIAAVVEQIVAVVDSVVERIAVVDSVVGKIVVAVAEV